MDTTNYMFGRWLYEDEKNTIQLDVNLSHHRVFLSFNGHKIDFDHNAHWFDDFLCFVGTQNQYYVRFANETSLVFGKHKDTSNVIGDIEWEYKFTRIK